VLRLHGLGRWSLWLDEALQYRQSSTPLNQLYSTLLPQDMPLSFLLTHSLVAAGFDHSEWQLRLPFAIFGVAPPLHRIGNLRAVTLPSTHP
jgi:hypothetical protein